MGAMEGSDWSEPAETGELEGCGVEVGVKKVDWEEEGEGVEDGQAPSVPWARPLPVGTLEVRAVMLSVWAVEGEGRVEGEGVEEGVPALLAVESGSSSPLPEEGVGKAVGEAGEDPLGAPEALPLGVRLDRGGVAVAVGAPGLGVADGHTQGLGEALPLFKASVPVGDGEAGRVGEEEAQAVGVVLLPPLPPVGKGVAERVEKGVGVELPPVTLGLPGAPPPALGLAVPPPPMPPPEVALWEAVLVCVPRRVGRGVPLTLPLPPPLCVGAWGVDEGVPTPPPPAPPPPLPPRLGVPERVALTVWVGALGEEEGHMEGVEECKGVAEGLPLPPPTPSPSPPPEEGEADRDTRVPVAAMVTEGVGVAVAASLRDAVGVSEGERV